MEKERLEHISIIMEIVAFFFVTIDLYGKERLSKLRESLKVISERKRNYDSSVWSYIFSMLLTLIIVSFVYIPLFALLLLVPDIHMLIPIIIYSITFGTAVLGWSSDFVYNTSIKYVGLLYRMLSLMPIEGIMLIVGALLFVTAKLILYFSI